MEVGRKSEELRDDFGGDIDLRGLAGGYLAGGDTGYLGYLAVQSPDSGLAGVLVDDLLNRALEETYLALLQAVGLKLLGYQVALGLRISSPYGRAGRGGWC